MNITIKLLSEVLKRQVEIIDIDECKCMIRNSTYFDNEQIGIIYQYLYGNKEIRFMTIYEFAFKCKEWASKKEYQIISGLSDEQAYRKEHEKAYSKVLWCEGDDIHREYKDMIFVSHSEQQAIFDACEWILKEKNK